MGFRTRCLATAFLVACRVIIAEDNKPAPQTVTLERAIDLALFNNRDLLSSRIAVRNQEAGLDLSRSPFRTTLRPDGNFQASDQTQSYFYGMNATKQFSLGTRVNVTAGYQSNEVDGSERRGGGVGRVELTQPLFRRMNREAVLEPVDDARSDLRLAERNLYLRQSEIILEVIRSYEQILLLQQRIKSSEASFLRLDGLITLGKAREAQGRQTRVDSLRVELQRGQAQVRLQNEQEQLATEQENIQDLLNLKQPVVLDAKGRESLELELPDFDKGVQQALTNRLDYANTLEAYRNAERKHRITSLRMWPDLDLSTSYQREEEPFGRDDDSWFAGLRLGAEYNPRDEKLRIRQSANSRELARLEIENRKFLIGREVRREFRAYRRARADLVITQRNVELANKRLELARALFDLGRGDNFSVTDAETALVDTETTAFAAQAEAHLSSFRVLNALGLLIEVPENLKPEPVDQDD